MADLTPPPDRPMPPAARERVRALLLRESPRRSRLLVPGVAAASVLAVVALGAYLAGSGGGDPTAPAGSGPGTTSSPAHLPDAPSESPSRQPPSLTGPEAVSSRRAAPPQRQPSIGCERAVQLPGAQVTASRGTVSLFENAESWVICDSYANQDGGVPTLLETHRKDGPYAPDRSTLAISMNFSMNGGAQYFAAGKAFAGVESISYTFPDGHVADAVIADGLWSMDYRPSGGPLAEGDLRGLEPVRVSVDGRVFTLEWGADTCAQRNHGC